MAFATVDSNCLASAFVTVDFSWAWLSQGSQTEATSEEDTARKLRRAKEMSFMALVPEWAFILPGDNAFSAPDTLIVTNAPHFLVTAGTLDPRCHDRSLTGHGFHHDAMNDWELGPGMARCGIKTRFLRFCGTRPIYRGRTRAVTN